MPEFNRHGLDVIKDLNTALYSSKEDLYREKEVKRIFATLGYTKEELLLQSSVNELTEKIRDYGIKQFGECLFRSLSCPGREKGEKLTFEYHRDEENFSKNAYRIELDRLDKNNRLHFVHLCFDVATSLLYKVTFYKDGFSSERNIDWHEGRPNGKDLKDAWETVKPFLTAI